jgi:hypothetical protein
LSRGDWQWHDEHLAKDNNRGRYGRVMARRHLLVRTMKPDVAEDGLPIVARAHGIARYPADHMAGMRVPKGGSSCSSCEYLGDNQKTCKNDYFTRWNQSNVLPAPADEYCSDWYEEA